MNLDHRVDLLEQAARDRGREVVNVSEFEELCLADPIAAEAVRVWKARGCKIGSVDDPLCMAAARTFAQRYTARVLAKLGRPPRENLAPRPGAPPP